MVKPIHSLFPDAAVSPKRARKVVDACIFDGELDMLEFRFRLLEEVVDEFIIVEANKTYSGQPKPFTDFGDRFDWVTKPVTIRRFQSSYDEVSQEGAWKREFEHRNEITVACEHLQADDLVILSDVDEIPSRDVVRAVRDNPVDLPKTCLQQVFFYNLQFLHGIEGSDGLWRGSIFTTAALLRTLTPQELRERRGNWETIPDAGWHLSNFGGVERLQHKLRSFSHYPICDKPEFTDEEHLKECFRTGQDPCGREDDVKNVSADFFPGYVIEAAKKFKWQPQKSKPVQIARPVISILHPTARPEKWGAAYAQWLDTCDDPSRVEYVLVPEWDLEIEGGPTFPNTVVERNHGRPCLVDSYNQAAELAQGQVLVVSADDFFPFPHWDTELLAFLGNRLDKEAVVWVDNPTMLIQPIITRPYYERYGYLFYSGYFGWYADNEFDTVARRDGVVLDARDVLPFRHAHHVIDPVGTVVNPVDPVYKRIVDEGKTTGKGIFEQRRAVGFPPEDKQKPRTQPLISLLHTTCRQGSWSNPVQSWYDNADNPDQVEYVLVPESSRFESPVNIKLPFKHQVVEFNKGRDCPVDGWNQAARISHGKVMVLTADDLFATPHWDTKLLEVLGNRLDVEAVVWPDADPNDTQRTDVISHPIMTRKYHDRYGFFFWPEYENWGCEVELAAVAKRDGVLIDARDALKLEHRAPNWTGEPKDKDNLRIEKLYAKSKDLLEQRGIEGYPRTKLGPQVQRLGGDGDKLPKLSILICSIPRRSSMLKRLLDSLLGQAAVLPTPQDVEILYLVDDRKLSIGVKRNRLIEAALGQYTCFIDDDDRVWADYIALIFDVMKNKDEPDCIGISGICTTNGLHPKISYFSDAAKVLRNRNLSSLKQGTSDDSIPIAHVCHLSPIKRSITSRVKFMDTSWGEDRDWATKITPLLESIGLVEKPIYHYDFYNTVSETQKAGTMGKSSTHRYRHHIDDPMQALYGLPDWAIVNLIHNESVSLDNRKAYARYLKDKGSPQAKEPQIVDLLRDTNASQRNDHRGNAQPSSRLPGRQDGPKENARQGCQEGDAQAREYGKKELCHQETRSFPALGPTGWNTHS